MKTCSTYQTCSARQAFTLIELLVVLAIIGLLASLLVPALARAKEKARNIACVSQLRQLGIAVRMYADDHQQRLPSAELLPSRPVRTNAPLPGISEVLGPYLRGGEIATNTASIFRCPSDQVGRHLSEGSSYEWNVELNGRRMDETRTSEMRIVRIEVVEGKEPNVSDESKELAFPPETTPLLLDYEDFHPRSRGTGKNVVFMDGHVAPLE